MSAATTAPAPKAKRATKAMRVNRPECAKAARAILSAFDWSKSEEGHEFWSRIHSRLRVLAGKKS